MLLEGEWAPGNGTTVQFLIHRENRGKDFDTLTSKVPTPQIQFVCMPQENSPLRHSSSPENTIEAGISIDGKFIAASEGGFSMDDGLSQPGLQGIWQCTTPHVAASLTLPH